jgi:hypothetical protein
MKLSIVTKNFGTQTIDTDWFSPSKVSSSSTIFKAVEYLFDEWYSFYSVNNRDVKGCYEGWGEDEPAIYYKRGAIVSAIESMIDTAIDTNKRVITSKDMKNMDLEACFEI